MTMVNDIKNLTDDELELEMNLYWKLLSIDFNLKDWESIEKRVRVIGYEISKRCIPVMTYHYLADDERMKDDSYGIRWNTREFYKIDDSLEYKYPSYIETYDEFINKCKGNTYNDEDYLFNYAIKKHDYFVVVYGLSLTVEAILENCQRTDFKYIVVYQRW